MLVAKGSLVKPKGSQASSLQSALELVMLVSQRCGNTSLTGGIFTMATVFVKMYVVLCFVLNALKKKLHRSHPQRCMHAKRDFARFPAAGDDFVKPRGIRCVQVLGDELMSSTE